MKSLSRGPKTGVSVCGNKAAAPTHVVIDNRSRKAITEAVTEQSYRNGVVRRGKDPQPTLHPLSDEEEENGNTMRGEDSGFDGGQGEVSGGPNETSGRGTGRYGGRSGEAYEPGGSNSGMSTSGGAEGRPPLGSRYGSAASTRYAQRVGQGPPLRAEVPLSDNGGRGQGGGEVDQGRQREARGGQNGVASARRGGVEEDGEGGEEEVGGDFLRRRRVPPLGGRRFASAHTKERERAQEDEKTNLHLVGVGM